MLARLLRLTTFGLVAIAVSAAVLAMHERVFLGAMVFGLAASMHAIVLGIEFLLLVAVGTGESEVLASPSGRSVVRAWLHEAVAAPRIFCWQQPFRSRLHADLVPSKPKGRPGIVLVHGYVCNRGLWNPWLSRLLEREVPFLAVNLEPVFGRIERYTLIIERAVLRMELATGVRPVIVAHSMGGLAVRSWLDAHQADDRVNHIVTIGTPHHGTWLARFGFTANARQMRLNSPWLRALAEREPPARAARFTCFYSDCDNIVFPASAATLPGADNRWVPGAAHLDLLRQDLIFREVLRRVDAS